MFHEGFHVGVAALIAFTLWYDQQYLDIPYPHEGYANMYFKGRSMFLTVWCMILTMVYFFVSSLNDFFGTNAPSPQSPPLIRRLKDVMFSFSFPIGVYVCSMFWTVYLYDDQLIFPDFVKAIVPNWVNSIMHFFVAVFFIIEVLITNITYPSRFVGLTITLTISIAYLIWMHVLQARTGVFPYPLFDALSLFERFIFLSIGMVVGLGYYVLGEKISLMNSVKHISHLNGVNRVNGVNKNYQHNKYN